MLALAVWAAGAVASQAGDVAQAASAAFTGSLPVAPGQTVAVSQGNNQGDHVGLQRYAFDFTVAGQHFLITAAQSGTVIGLNDSSDIQCSGPGAESAPMRRPLRDCWTHANFVLIKDDDGVTASLYMHLLQGSTCSARFCVRVGEHVRQGAPIARAGTTGWSTGIHLHFQAEVPPLAAEQNPYSGWWFTNSVPVRFTNPEVIAQDSNGVPETGQVFHIGGGLASPALPVP
jgi:Peptidase family M23